MYNNNIETYLFCHPVQNGFKGLAWEIDMKSWNSIPAPVFMYTITFFNTGHRYIHRELRIITIHPICTFAKFHEVEMVAFSTAKEVTPELIGFHVGLYKFKAVLERTTVDVLRIVPVEAICGI